MAIANIVCRSGVGPTATIGLLVTHGLSQGATVIVTKTGGDDAWRYRKKLKERERYLEEQRQEKLEAAQELRRQIEEAYNPPVPKKLLTKKERKVVEAKKAEIPELEINLDLLEKELLLLAKQIELQRLEDRRLREEDDIKAIMMALNAPFQTVH